MTRSHAGALVAALFFAACSGQSPEPKTAPAAPVTAPLPSAEATSRPDPGDPNAVLDENGQPLPSGTTRPRLLDLVLNLPFPKEADKQHIDRARVVLHFVVNERGDAERITVVQGHPVFDAPTVDAMRKRKFAPAKLRGKPVAAQMTLNVRYER